jgi:hypothetical protein
MTGLPADSLGSDLQGQTGSASRDACAGNDVAVSDGGPPTPPTRRSPVLLGGRVPGRPGSGIEASEQLLLLRDWKAASAVTGLPLSPRR